MADRDCPTRVLTAKSDREWVRAHFHFGFTLIELLVVIAIIAVLAAMLFPVLTSARAAGMKTRCASQLQQLATASLLYADDNNSRFVTAALDIYDTGGGLQRWHGVRPALDKDFNPSKGPLWVYMNRSGGLKKCSLSSQLTTLAKNENAFESGGGGFGYNGTYVGGTLGDPTCASTLSQLRRPSRTVMFSDTAMPIVAADQNTQVIEYSFCEPPYRLYNGKVTTAHNSPSIHFRHGGIANIAWCDGHVSAEKMSFTTKRNIYTADNRSQSVGWFGPDNNSLFDCD